MLSIIITHYRTPILLKLCLKSIRENIKQVEHEVIVVDSQSDELTQELVKKNFPGAKFIPFSKNLGYAKILNVGIGTCTGKYILILNADIIITGKAINEMIDYLDNNPDTGLVGPRLLSFSQQVQNSCFRFPTIGAVLARRTFWGKTNWGQKQLDHFLMKDKDLSSTTPVDWLQGSAILVRHEALERVGLMDERFFMYLEDADWCHRFWQNGYQVVYLPSAQVYHYYGRASKKWGPFLDVLFNKYSRLHLISAFKYFSKWKYNI